MKLKRRIHALLRLAIQITFFIFMPALFSAGFMGAKYICEQIYKHEPIALNPFVLTMLVLFGATLLFGRFFCGYACSFGALGDWLFSISAALQKKFRKKVFRLPDKLLFKLQYIKFFILLAVLIACLTNTYSLVSSADPWGFFGALRAGNFALEGFLYAGIVFGLIVIGMFIVERFFCQFLCPLGALFALLPMLPLLPFTRDKEKCTKGCSVCTKTCPASISLGEAKSKQGECFQCGKCSARCPKQNVTTGIVRLKGNEIALVLCKAISLFLACYILI